MPTNIMKTGSDCLGSQLKSKAGTDVTYVRETDSGNEYTVDVTATVGSTEFERSDEMGIVERIESRDYLIDVADLVLSGVTVLPAVATKYARPFRARPTPMK